MLLLNFFGVVCTLIVFAFALKFKFSPFGMMAAIDSVVLTATNDAAALVAATAVSGDSLVVRSFSPPAIAR